ncbi:hypothetical protein [Spiroplasma endosymbiont of Aspidapion aeneum]|uniref:hypothetical protein n=1 Tax=Spiroplasma endosymbiont of Aspidapion aeneum TaxID=3066276 RepID=UPI00313C7CBD
MKIINTLTDKTLDFNFNEKNIFLCKSLDSLYNLKDFHESLFSAKSSGSKFIINYSNHDYIIDKSNFKLFNVPSYLDLYKDICGGNKTILKELITIVINSNFFEEEELILIKNLIDTLQLKKIKPISYLIELIKSSTDYDADFVINDNIVDYISTNVIMHISKNDTNIDNIISQYELKKIYLEILYIISQQSDKNFYYVFINPFIGLNFNEFKDFFNSIKRFNFYSILCNNMYSINNEDLLNLKIEFYNFIDISSIINKKDEYILFWDGQGITEFEKFIYETTNKIIDLNLFNNTNNNLKYFDQNELNFIEILKNYLK